ncbi:sensor histidine kinase [Hymenobacter sp. DG25A]|uniref:sensor histidine kinase n=1 Tax=Hymenobacter sp. DG25A TaxID=1385663 RepID=UPI0006C8AACC|nr:CHASE3 domain-containing protein [Hymenobacter sp. DG25A]
MRLNLTNKITLGFGMAALVLLLTAAVAYYSNQRLSFFTRQVSHSYQVLQATADLRSELRDAQASVRNYLLLGDTAYIRPFRRAEGNLSNHYATLRLLTSDNPAQQIRLDTLRAVIDQQMAELSGWTTVRVTSPTARTMIVRTQAQLERTRQLLNAIKNEEDLLLQDRDDSQNFYASTTPVALMVSALLAIALVLWLMRRILQELRANDMLQKELADINTATRQRIAIIDNLVEQIVQGDYSIKIKDEERDSLGRLTHSLNRMTKQLSEAFSSLQNRNRELDQFAYVASHDLKAPLRGIMTVVKWIEDELAQELSPQMRQYLDMMKGRLSRLEDLINGLLAYARAGRTTPRVEAVNVAELVREVADMVVPPTFQLHLSDLPIFTTDRLSLQQVFTNLFSNAVKYHDRGAGTIYVSSREVKKMYEFTVADDGPGIAREYREKIFLMFQTLRDRNTAESTGIGLSIVKKIIDEQKGSIWVEEAAHGRGAAFIFTWPKATTATPAPEPAVSVPS